MERQRFLPMHASNQDGEPQSLYVPLDHNGLPYLLGTGRHAVVLLGRTSKDEWSPANINYAIKCLKADSDLQYATLAAQRFFVEIQKASEFSAAQTTLVSFRSKGVFGNLAPWSQHFLDVPEDVRTDVCNDGFEYVVQYFKLQGPFYVIELCQGTLNDLLEKDGLWSDLPVYQAVGSLKTSLTEQARLVCNDVHEVVTRYFCEDIAAKSGYELLRAFRCNEDSNRVRNYAVMELFAQVAHAVAQLHAEKEAEGNWERPKRPLAHRDLKTGNIFPQHSIEVVGFDKVTFKLSDLGFVTGPEQINSGDWSIKAGLKGAAAPGSQYFRAPEQAQLPVEVRIDVRPDRPTCVEVRSSKIESIHRGDFLSIGDKFSARPSEGLDDIGVLRIDQVRKLDEGHYELDLEAEVPFDQFRDLQAHVIRATGFHTDGYSLGALLYDLISGGKNPETFYTYCLVIFTDQFVSNEPDHSRYEIDDIVDILCPNNSGLGLATHERLTDDEKLALIAHVLEEDDLDTLLERIMTTALGYAPRTDAPALGLGEKLRIMSVVQSAKTREALVANLARLTPATSPTNGSRASLADPHRDHELRARLKHYRFRHFHVVNDLLHDTRGVAIPREVIRIIVRCMLRDMQGSYYASNRGDGYASFENRIAAESIFGDVQALLKQQAFQPPDDNFPDRLRDNLLFKLRSLAQPSIVRNGVTTDAV